MIVPTSSTATYFVTSTSPVSVSTSTTQMWAPNGNTRLAGSKNDDSSSPGSTPSGRLWAVQAEKASSGMVLALSGAPFTVNDPASYSRSSSATSSSWAAIFRAFSTTFLAAMWTAGPPTAAPRLP